MAPITSPSELSQVAARDQALAHVVDMNTRVVRCRANIESLKDQRKDWEAEKKSLIEQREAIDRQIEDVNSELTAIDDNSGSLKAKIRELQDSITDKLQSFAKGQMFMDMEAGKAADPGALDRIEVLGLPGGLIEKLNGKDIDTVADLEAAMCADKIRSISGIGDAAVDRIEDAVLKYREQQPVPEESAN